MPSNLTLKQRKFARKHLQWGMRTKKVENGHQISQKVIPRRHVTFWGLKPYTKGMGKFEFKEEDYVLYLLNHIKPERSDFWRLNKIAFLVEFAYLFFKEKALSNADYAAITHGPVINDYGDLLEKWSLKN